MRYLVKNSFPKILVTGGAGQLALAIKNNAISKQHHFIFCDKKQLNIMDHWSIKHAIKEHQPHIIINTAAYTAVDLAEKEHRLAMEINHFGAKNLALICQEKNLPLIHFSTDYVFDGYKNHPYNENDNVNPLSVYGLSKFSGEEEIRNYNEKHFIIRISGLFSEYKNNFLKTILRLAKEKNELQIVNDQITCPTYAGDVTNLLNNLIAAQSGWGTYHFCNTEATSWYDFALAIINAAKNHHSFIVNKITAITSNEYKTLAKRPLYSVLNNSKIQQYFSIQLNSWQSGVEQSIQKLNG